MVKNQLANKNHMWKELVTKEKLIELYSSQLKSKSEISNILNCSITLITLRIKMWKIPPRTYEEQMKIEKEKGTYFKAHKHQIVKGSVKRNRKIYLKIAKSYYKWECMICAVKHTNDNFDLVVHHKDGDNKNNSPDNLQILCQGCHARLHRRR